MTDRQVALQVFGRCKAGLPKVQSVLADRDGLHFVEEITKAIALRYKVIVKPGGVVEIEATGEPCKFLQWLAPP